MNLVALYYLFSMQTKEAVENSLYIIFFSQMANLIFTILTGNVPEFDWLMLSLMVSGGILGGVVGRKINSKIDEKTVEKLFIGLMGILICINIYNIFAFMR